MAAVNYDNIWYANYGNGTSTGYWSVSKWTNNSGSGMSASVGQLVRQTGISTTATVTSGAGALVTWKNNAGSALVHNLTSGDAVVFTSVGATGITSGQVYYVIASGLTTTAFEFSATYNGTAFTTSGSGTITATAIHQGNERVYVCTQAGTGATSLEPIWTFTRGAIQPTDGTIKWQECTGQPSVNGDSVNTLTWTNVKQLWPLLGTIIQNVAGTYYFICTASASIATSGTEPSWTLTAGATTVDGGITWTCLGSISTLAYGAWAAPHARWMGAAATNWGQAGNTIFIADNHAEVGNSGSVMFFAMGSASLPCYVYSIDHTASVPPTLSSIKAGASITAGHALNASVTGYTYFYGLSVVTTGTLQISSGSTIVDTCTFSVNYMFMSGGSAKQINTVISCTSVSYVFSCGAASNLLCEGGPASPFSGTIPTALVNVSSTGANYFFEGLDLSSFGSGYTLVVAATSGSGYVQFKNCKLGAAVTPVSGLSDNEITVDLINCDSAGTNYHQQRYMYSGSLVQNTSVVRTGGATDGTTPISWQIVTTSNSSFINPFKCFPIAIWNTVTGSTVNVTIFGIWGGGSVPNKNQIWIEIDYLGSAASPLSTVVTQLANPLLLTAQATDTSSWGGSTTPFAMTIALTPQMLGLINITVMAAAPSTTFYIDPQVYLH